VDVDQQFYRLRSNQRLPAKQRGSGKLTEPAVSECTARQFAENDMISRYVRATFYMELAVRRRSSAAIR